MITGKNNIGNKQSNKGNQIFNTYNATTGEPLSDRFYAATDDEVEEAVSLAKFAFPIYSKVPQKKRAKFLTAIVDEIMDLGEVLITRASLETALPEARLEGERGRTVNQLRMFAKLLEEGNWVKASIDTAMPDRQPIPKPDLRKMFKALGPVVVFGASNFPLAYSTAGGDTASALAAGCPVIVKSHPAHAGTGELVSGAILKAAEKTGMPNGVFSNLNDAGYTVGTALVKNPAIKAVGFTGSLRGGRALMDHASQREEPIPVYAEMGSINPVLLLEEAIKKRAVEFGKIYAGSVTLGVGQFCTNPGLMIGIEGESLNAFIQSLAEEIKKALPEEMLTDEIAAAYSSGLDKVLSQKNVKVEGVTGTENSKLQSRPLLASTSGNNFINNPNLHEEVFGPFSLVVKCKDKAELKLVVEKLKGQLTATVIAEENEIVEYSEIIESLSNKVGRIIFNGVPTGVEVCPSMHHGGPYPASSDSKFTAVGVDAITRFVRPLSYQNWPENLLPDELKNSNPLGIWRTVNGKLSQDQIL